MDSLDRYDYTPGRGSDQWQPSGYDVLVNEVKVLYAAGTNTWSMDDFTYDTELVPVEGTTWGALKDLYR